MDIISKAIDEILFTIPREILKLAYSDPANYRAAPITLEEQIRRKTINARVLVDCNLVGGDTIIVPLTGLKPQQIDQFNYVFEVPPDRVNYRTILSVLSVNYMSYNSVTPNQAAGVVTPTQPHLHDVASAANRAMSSRSNIPIISNSECYVTGHNLIMVRNHLITAAVVQARCVVCNDENLMNISIRNAPDFAMLCKFAVKSYIYNTLLVAMDRGYLERGQELGVVRNYIEGLSDAEENYQTFLKETWGAVGIMSDRLAYEDLIKIQLNPGI